MPFTIRLYRRFPFCSPVTYQTGLFEGYGTVWNLSLTGWRFSGDLPLRIGEMCSLTVILPKEVPKIHQSRLRFSASTKLTVLFLNSLDALGKSRLCKRMLFLIGVNGAVEWPGPS